MNNKSRIALLLVGTLLVAAPALGQGFSGPALIQQPTTINHCPKILATGSNVLVDSGSACGSGGGSPGGADTQVQFNQAGSFGGISGFTSNGTSGIFSSGNLKLTGATSGTATLNAAAIAGAGVFTLPSGTDTLVGRASTDTLSGKAMDGGANTFTNIDNPALVNSTVTLNSHALALGGTLSLTAADVGAIGSVAGSNGVAASTVSGAVTLSATASSVAVSGTTRAIVAGDGGTTLVLNNASPIAMSIPVAGSAGFTAGANGFGLELFGKGAGTGTITPASGTINGASTATVSQNQDCLLSADVITTTNYILSCFTGIGGGGGGLTSVGLSFTGGLLSVTNSPLVANGTLAMVVAGTSGGVPYFSSSSAWASSAALTANLPVIGGGAGAAPTVGTRSGNTTSFATTTGSLTSGHCVQWDASGNAVDSGGACGGGSSNTYTATFSGNVSGTPSATAGMAINAQTATLTDNNTASSGTAAAFPVYYFAAPTLAATNTLVTTTTAATVRISGPPISGTNETLASIEALALSSGDLTMEANTSQLRMYNLGSPGVANREELDIGWSANNATINVAKNGTGVSRGLVLSAGTTSTMFFQTGGSSRMLMSGTTLGSNTSNSWQLNMASASATVPSIIPSQGCTNCGWGSQTPASNVSGIISGAEIVRMNATAWTQIAGQTVDKGYAVGSLPTGITGGHAYVTDANAACTYASTPTGGGSTFCPVAFDGSVWREY